MSLKIENINLLYDKNMVLKNINIDFPLEKIHVLLGSSGAGKSSFLRLLNALSEPHSGSIKLGNMLYAETHPLEIRKRVGMVFQKPALFEGSVYENLIWGLKIQKKTINESEIRKKLISLDLPLEYLEKDIENLSVGEQQRVCIVRTLLVDPEIILFDEPVSALDPLNAYNVIELIKKINLEYKKTIFLVSHIVESAVEIADTISVFKQGEIVFYGSKEDYLSNYKE
ncbi:MAG: ATP-binding cassette domain-containing protein [Candidatus Cloacimonetes bacterium]|nr:ATP-binding cassette domain-containing protein [Candidatus Cloacimonadota bacterium]